MRVADNRRKTPMIRIGMPWIIEASTKLDRLTTINENIEKFSLFMALTGAKETLDQLFIHSVYKPYLRVSFLQGVDLSGRLQNAIERLNKDWKMPKFNLGK